MSKSKGIKLSGAPSDEEIKTLAKFPPKELLDRGSLVYIECIEGIPCNPCETACPHGVIKVGSPITNMPEVKPELCVGCGLCVAACPGQAIYLKNLVQSETTASVTFPFEYYPLPVKGEKVQLVDRIGEPVCEGTVLSVRNPKINDRTAVVAAEFPKQYFDEVISMKRLCRKD